jgi:AraC-like DNA-binding protein
LQEAETVEGKFRVLEMELLRRLRPGAPHPAVSLALDHLRRFRRICEVRDLASASGYSARRLGQLFEDEIGLGPKSFSRIVRFQRAVRRLHAGGDVRWDELALDCGYCDQSHFANDFHGFSGMNPTTYSRRVGEWANHVRL